MIAIVRNTSEGFFWTYRSARIPLGDRSKPQWTKFVPSPPDAHDASRSPIVEVMQMRAARIDFHRLYGYFHKVAFKGSSDCPIVAFSEWSDSSACSSQTRFGGGISTQAEALSK
jgi:hypothetical protein